MHLFFTYLAKKDSLNIFKEFWNWLFFWMSMNEEINFKIWIRQDFFVENIYKIQKGYVNLNTKTSWYVTRIDLLSCNNTMTGCYCRYSYGVTGLRFHYRGSPTYTKITNTVSTTTVFGLCTCKWGIVAFIGDFLQSHYQQFHVTRFFPSPKMRVRWGPSYYQSFWRNFNT